MIHEKILFGELSKKYQLQLFQEHFSKTSRVVYDKL